MHRRYVSVENQHMHQSRGGGCFDCISSICCCIASCWGILLCSLLGILLIVMASMAIVFFFFKPQMPSYSIDSLNLTNFDIRNDGKLYTEIGLALKAENPNKGVAMDYGNNNITLVYSGTDISTGCFTPFLQPGKNTTVISMVLKGQHELSQTMQQDFVQQDKAGRIPLLVRVKVPVKIVIIDTIKLKRVTIDANCTLEVDHLLPNKKPNILKKEFSYDFKF